MFNILLGAIFLLVTVVAVENGGDEWWSVMTIILTTVAGLGSFARGFIDIRRARREREQKASDI